MTDQRPQYGEYATPEEQRRLAGLPPSDAGVSVSATSAGPAEPAAAGPGAPVPHAVATQNGSAAASAARPRQADRIVTLAMLAYGLVNVIMTGLSYLDLPTVLNRSMEILGIEGEFTNFAQGKVWGTVAAIVLAVGWAVTAALSVRRLRRGKLTWWVPLVGGVVTMFVASVCITVPMMGDPAFLSYVGGMTGQ